LVEVFPTPERLEVFITSFIAEIYDECGIMGGLFAD
jgi:hypothetical protein